jgi:hypothetical protein
MFSFRILGTVWNSEYTVCTWGQIKSIFSHCHAYRDMYFVADEVGSSTCLPARFDQPISPIRDVISIHSNQSMLSDFTMYHGVNGSAL